MKLRAAKGAGEGFWLRAEKQSGGKGRLGRTWESPEGNLYCSTLIDLHSDDPAASSLSFATALAVYRTMDYYLPEAVIILKWPNDILVSNAKICGILLERSGDTVIVGIGVNIAVPPQLHGRKTTSLHREGAGVKVTPPVFLDKLSVNFVSQMAEWRQFGIPVLLEKWQNLAHPLGTQLSVSAETGDRVTGQFEGLSQDGALRLRKPNGTLIEIRAGDVSMEQ